MTKLIKIGYQGDIGSNNETIAKLFILEKKQNHYLLIPCITSFNVVNKLKENKIDIGIIAIKNKIGGEVTETISALSNFNFKIIAQKKMNIKHCFCKLTKETIVKKIVSHPQAIDQISIYCKNNYPDIPIESYIDTAKAAIDLASGLLHKNTAIISPLNAAINNNLYIENVNISNITNNITTFIIIKKV